MSKGKSTPMTRKAASRIVRSIALNNDGKIPPKSFGTRVDRTVQRQDAATTPKPQRQP